MSIWRYRGITTRTSWPRRRSSFDSEAATSATPPDLANGASSDVATSTLSCFESGAVAAAPSPGMRRPSEPDGGTCSMSRPSRLTTTAISIVSPA